MDKHEIPPETPQIKIEFITLTKLLCKTSIHELVQISQDQGGWDENQFLFDLPDKWTLSFIAKKEDVVIGYAILSHKWADRVHLHEIVVSGEYRSLGIGARMLNEIIERCELENLSLKVSKSNTSAIRFYLRHGLSITKSEGEYHWVWYKRAEADKQI